MDYKEDGSQLVITVDAEKQSELKKLRDDKESGFHSNQVMYDQFEELVCNSDLSFVDPADTGDLTSAPMLGIYDENDDVVKRWAFMDYQVRSVLEDLADNGRVIFIS